MSAMKAVHVTRVDPGPEIPTVCAAVERAAVDFVAACSCGWERSVCVGWTVISVDGKRRVLDTANAARQWCVTQAFYHRASHDLVVE